MLEIWRKTKIGLAIAVATLTCPCHLVLILPLVLSVTAGTSIGTVISRSPLVFILLSLALFLGSLFLTFRWLSGKKDRITSCNRVDVRSVARRPVIQINKLLTGKVNPLRKS